MRIAYLVNRYPSVSHTFIRREIRALESLGHRVDRYSVRDTSDMVVHPEDRIEAEQTNVILGPGAVLRILFAVLRTCLTRPGRLLTALRMAIQVGRRAPSGLTKHFIYVAEACLMFHWLRKTNVEAVHAHFGTNSTAVALFCRILGGPPYSFTVHGPEEFDHPEEWALKTKAKHAKFIAAVSSYGRSQLFRWLDASDWKKVQIVRCGIQPDEFVNHASIPREPRLVCVGRICEQKGHGVLIRALGELKRRGIDFHMTLAGDGDMRQQIEEEIAAQSISDSVTITGWIDSDRVRELLDDSRGLVLPSFAEGLPVVIMEAMAMHRPVISTYIAGIPELVEDRIHGWLIPAGSVEKLADAIESLLASSPDRLTEIGGLNREQVCRFHDIREIARQLSSLISGASIIPKSFDNPEDSVSPKVSAQPAQSTERIG